MMTSYRSRSLFSNTMWIPKFRYELVEWLTNRYSEDGEKFKRMRKKQLMAIYFKVRGVDSGGI